MTDRPQNTSPSPTSPSPQRWTTTLLADGAPLSGGSPPVADSSLPETDPAPTPGTMVDKVTKAATRIRQFEGMRGYSVRVAVIMKHLLWFATIVGCSATVHWAFSAVPAWRYGGLMVLYSVTAMLAIGAIGCVLYADSRIQIYEQTRHFVFGIVLGPATAVAWFMRLTTAALSGPGAESDVFANMLRGNAFPLLFFSLVAIPPLVFAKYVFGGVRTLNRSAMADEEHLAAMMRQDGWQR